MDQLLPAPAALSIDAGTLGLSKRMSVPEVANHLVCSKCGARHGETYNPIWARPDARVGGSGHFPDFSARSLMRAPDRISENDGGELVTARIRTCFDVIRLRASDRCRLPAPYQRHAVS